MVDGANRDSGTGLSRREMLRRSLAIVGAAVSAGMALTACGDKELTCTDVSSLTDAEKQLRASLGYVDRTTVPAKRCGNCNFFTAGQANACGTCKVLKGPVHPQGNCRSWALKAG